MFDTAFHSSLSYVQDVLSQRSSSSIALTAHMPDSV